MSSSVIRKRAETLLVKHDLFKIPVDVYKVAKKLGIRVREEDFEDDISGVLVVKKRKATIGVNKNHHPNRQRFTIAHEIGHYLLHHDEDNSDDLYVDSNYVFLRDGSASTGKIKQEIEANSFAAELLMPRSLILEKLKGINPDLPDNRIFPFIASHFEVSEQAFMIRLTKLGLIDS